MSWNPAIELDGAWHPDKRMAFHTEYEAREAARRMFQNWSYATGFTVVESDQSPNFAWRNGEAVAIITQGAEE